MTETPPEPGALPGPGAAAGPAGPGRLSPLRWVQKWGGLLVSLARKVEGVLEAQEKAAQAIANLQKEVQALRVDIAELKGREGAEIARVSADLHRTLGRMEGRVGRIEGRVFPFGI